MAARASDADEQKRTEIEMAQQAYVPQKVNYYVRGTERGLGELAQSFGVDQKDLCRWNQMRVDDALTPGACVVFYKRAFELDRVHLARSLQPDSVPESSGFRLASAESSGAASDAPIHFRRTGFRERRLSLASSYTYALQRGDTLEKVARRTGTDLKTLCALNGLGPKAGVKPGQKIKLVSSKATSGSGDRTPASAGKSMQAVSAVNPRTSGKVVPAVYTALKPGQKIRLLEQVTAQQHAGAAAVKKISQQAAAKQSKPSSASLQANMKAVPDTRSKGIGSPPQKPTLVQKSSIKTISSVSSAPQAKVAKDPNKTLKK